MQTSEPSLSEKLSDVETSVTDWAITIMQKLQEMMNMPVDTLWKEYDLPNSVNSIEEFYLTMCMHRERNGDTDTNMLSRLRSQMSVYRIRVCSQYNSHDLSSLRHLELICTLPFIAFYLQSIMPEHLAQKLVKMLRYNYLFATSSDPDQCVSDVYKYTSSKSINCDFRNSSIDSDFIAGTIYIMASSTTAPETIMEHVVSNLYDITNIYVPQKNVSKIVAYSARSFNA